LGGGQDGGGIGHLELADGAVEARIVGGCSGEFQPSFRGGSIPDAGGAGDEGGGGRAAMLSMVAMDEDSMGSWNGE
jgi:hypothetical protein